MKQLNFGRRQNCEADAAVRDCIVVIAELRVWAHVAAPAAVGGRILRQTIGNDIDARLWVIEHATY